MIIQIYTWFYLMFTFVGIGVLSGQNKFGADDLAGVILTIPIIGRVLGWW